MHVPRNQDLVEPDEETDAALKEWSCVIKDY